MHQRSSPFFGRDAGAEPVAERAARAGGVDHVLGRAAVVAGGRLHGQVGAIVVLGKPVTRLLPAQVDWPNSMIRSTR